MPTAKTMGLEEVAASPDGTLEDRSSSSAFGFLKEVGLSAGVDVSWNGAVLGLET